MNSTSARTSVSPWTYQPGFQRVPVVASACFKVLNTAYKRKKGSVFPPMVRDFVPKALEITHEEELHSNKK